MIITVTTNPSVDRTISVPVLRNGSVNRVEMLSVDPGGKGVNVSRALKAFGTETFAVVVCGSFGSRWFDERLNSQKIPHKILLADGITRCNSTIVEANGSVTKINEPGFALTDEMLHSVRDALSELNLLDNWVVLAGRLNPEATLSEYQILTDFAHSLGARVAVDASGEELRVVAQNSRPELIKPNQHELAELVGRELHTVQDVIDAGREVIGWGVGSVLCSLGADGALFVTPSDVTHVEPVTPVVGVPVGAGDILLATFLAAGANGDALKTAVSWSAASVPLEGTSIPNHEQAQAVQIKVNSIFDANRVLVEVA